MIKLIVNADDFGMSLQVNAAIIQAFQEGLVSSTTLMANMSGFDDAVSTIKSTPVLVNAVGIHLNLFEGFALTSRIKNCNKLCNQDGSFHGKPIRMFDVHQWQQQIYDELKEQIIKVLDCGITPTHLDSHAHRHNNWLIGKIVIRLAHEFSIPAVRINGNLRKSSILRAALIKAHNLRLSINGLKKTDYQGSIPAVIDHLSRLNGVVEMITHPVYDDNRVLIDAEYKQPLSKLLDQADTITKISFSTVK